MLISSRNGLQLNWNGSNWFQFWLVISIKLPKLDQKMTWNFSKLESKWTEIFRPENFWPEIRPQLIFRPNFYQFWVRFNLFPINVQSNLDSITPNSPINMPGNMYMGNWYKWVFESVSAVTYFLSDFIFSPWCWLWEGIGHFMGLWVLFWVPKLSPNRIYMFSLPDSNLG